ncbi:hypothetical protein N7466_011209 [Penicillium verhagenii]|uniref:uncharacterized protein n=1 Tax=Penicillium verhagenii TaxID=1562060 RepID=UPI00254554F4|nr:uncharacterized protein N7466_011209 [Penicillium verhagenii]KAJ5917655.1 hypothetical protein N7466_011209 [Penicillium verhagenii]
MAVPNPAGEVLLIPTTFSCQKSLDEIAAKYKKLRLHGLQVDPKSFSSTYEDESQFSPATWRSRLLNPAGKTFVSVTNPDNEYDNKSGGISSAESGSPNTSFQRLVSRDWVGIVTMLGPVQVSKPIADKETTPVNPWDVFFRDGKYNVPRSAIEEDLKDSEVAYLVVGMFVLPEARQKGHASQLVKGLIQAARKDACARGVSKATISLEIEPGNATAQRLYERLGFVVCDKALPMVDKQGKTTYVVALIKEIDLT